VVCSFSLALTIKTIQPYWKSLSLSTSFILQQCKRGGGVWWAASLYRKSDYGYSCQNLRMYQALLRKQPALTMCCCGTFLQNMSGLNLALQLQVPLYPRKLPPLVTMKEFLNHPHPLAQKAGTRSLLVKGNHLCVDQLSATWKNPSSFNENTFCTKMKLSSVNKNNYF
jgi:hypothetical protein